MNRLILILTAFLLMTACGQDEKSAIKQSNNTEQAHSTKRLNSVELSEAEKIYIKELIKDDIGIASQFGGGGESAIGDYYKSYSADEITNDYADNEVRANNKYKDVVFFVYGVIAAIDAGIDDKPIVRFKTKSNYSLTSPLLNFNESEFGKVADLNKGQKAVFVCVGNSEIAGSPSLVDCHFPESFENTIFLKVVDFKYSESEELGSFVTIPAMLIASAKAMSVATNGFTKCKPTDRECLNKIEGTTEQYTKQMDELFPGLLKRINEIADSASSPK